MEELIGPLPKDRAFLSRILCICLSYTISGMPADCCFTDIKIYKLKIYLTAGKEGHGDPCTFASLF